MANGFNGRMAVAQRFEDELVDLLGGMAGIMAVARNGTEHTHPEFVALLRSNQTDGARFVRFAPDGVMLDRQHVIHFDAKAAKNIEKDAYRTYMDYVRSGCRVILFVKWNGRIYWQDVGKVRLIDGNITVRNHRNPFPVDADGWIHPRRANHYRPGAWNMSGTPYREIDLTSMRELATQTPPGKPGPRAAAKTTVGGPWQSNPVTLPER